jgi:hypothetical protein
MASCPIDGVPIRARLALERDGVAHAGVADGASRYVAVAERTVATPSFESLSAGDRDDARFAGTGALDTDGW